MVSASEYSASTGGALEQSVAYQYDAFGNRVQEAVTVGGVTTATQFGYNGWNPAKAGAVGNSGFDVFVEYTVQPNGQPAAATTTRYLDGNAVDQVFARIGATLGPAWLLQDKDMSVCDVIDGTGSLRDTIKYDAFGNVLTQTQITGSTATSETPQTDTWGGRYTFAGMQRDSATGLDHDNARDYSAIVGRFISQDPMGLSAGDSNLYRYVNNAPTNATDPSGLTKTEFPVSTILKAQLDSNWTAIKADAQALVTAGQNGFAALAKHDLPGAFAAFSDAVSPFMKLLNPARFTSVLIEAALFKLCDSSLAVKASVTSETDQKNNVSASAPTITLPGNNDVSFEFHGIKLGIKATPKLLGPAQEVYQISANNKAGSTFTYQFYHAEFQLDVNVTIGVTAHCTATTDRSFVIAPTVNFPMSNAKAQTWFAAFDQNAASAKDDSKPFTDPSLGFLNTGVGAIAPVALSATDWFRGNVYPIYPDLEATRLPGK